MSVTIDDLFASPSSQTAEGIGPWRVFPKSPLLIHQLTPRSALACLQTGSDPESLRPRSLESFWETGLEFEFQLKHHKYHEERRHVLMERVRTDRQRLQMEELKLWNTNPGLATVHDGRLVGEYERRWLSKSRRKQRHEAKQMKDFEASLVDDAEQQRLKLGQDERHCREQQQSVSHRQTKLKKVHQRRQLKLCSIEVMHRAHEASKAELARGSRAKTQLSGMQTVLTRQNIEHQLKFDAVEAVRTLESTIRQQVPQAVEAVKHSDPKVAAHEQRLEQIEQQTKRLFEKSQQENDERQQRRWWCQEAQRQQQRRHTEEQEHRRLDAFEQSQRQEELRQKALAVEQEKRDVKIDQLRRRQARDTEQMREQHYLKELRKQSNLGETRRHEQYDRLQTSRRIEGQDAREAKRCHAKEKAVAHYKATRKAVRAQQDEAQWLKRFDWRPPSRV